MRLGQQLTEDKLRLMFTPEFGMFIAPGCNGIRGAVTLGLAAVVVGYMYRFRWFVYAPVVAGAVLLGYLFNFVRLCLLVVYYKIALPYLWMQHTGQNSRLHHRRVPVSLCDVPVFLRWRTGCGSIRRM